MSRAIPMSIFVASPPDVFYSFRRWLWNSVLAASPLFRCWGVGMGGAGSYKFSLAQVRFSVITEFSDLGPKRSGSDQAGLFLSLSQLIKVHLF